MSNNAFETLKQLLTKAPILACKNLSKPFVLQTDVSDEGLGVALTQNIEVADRIIVYCLHWHPLKIHHRKRMSSRCNGCRKANLDGYKFTVLIDYRSLRWLRSLKNPTGQLAWSVLLLQHYEFDVKHGRGALNRIADGLSRNPTTDAEETPSDSLVIIWITDPTDS